MNVKMLNCIEDKRRNFEDGRRIIEDERLERRINEDEGQINGDEGRIIEDERQISAEKWKVLEGMSQDDTRKFLLEHTFIDKLVSSIEKNVSKGDHLYYQGAKVNVYDHHMLVTDVDDDNIEGIEYSGPFWWKALSQFLSLSALGQVVQRNISFKDLESKKVYKRIWPKELQRFSADEVIKRAKSRLTERKYHVLDNNCEHYVIWCMCNLDASLQIEEGHRQIWVVFKASVVSVLHVFFKARSVLLKIFANVSDDILNIISILPSPEVGFVIVACFEVAIAFNFIRDDRSHPDRDESKVNTIYTVAKAAGRVIGNAVGSVIGSHFGPIGALVGGALGAFAGHLVGWGYVKVSIGN